MENHIIIKFDERAIQSRTDEELTLNVNAFKDNFLNKFTYRSVINDRMLSGTEGQNTMDFTSLIGLCYVVGLNKLLLKEKKHLAQKMAAYDFVEYAYIEADNRLRSPLNPSYQVPSNKYYKKGKGTPNFIERQLYKNGHGDNYIGIDMEYAWQHGISGQGIAIATTDCGINDNHYNLKRSSLINADINNKDNKLATAMAGMLYAKDMGYGIKGLVHGADKYYALTKKTDPGIKKAIRTVSVLSPGDVAIFPMQSVAGPIDYDLGMRDIIQTALKAGIIVIVAAGNNAINLDADEYSAFRCLPDNGIIRVGAGNKVLKRKKFSTFGRMIHLQGWGSWDVVTTGYGNLYDGGVNNNYTDTYCGTAAATALVAAAVVAIQSWYKRVTGEILNSFEMRELLVKTGISSKNGYLEGIGPIPNIRNAIEKLKGQMHS